MNTIDAIVLLAYGSLAVELVLFPIPSEASTWQLLRPPADADREGAARARSHPLLVKLVLFVLPTSIGVAAFLLPLLCIVAPAIRAELASWSNATASVLGAVLVVVLLVAGRAVTFASVLQLRAQRRGQRRGGPFAPAGLFAWSRNPGLVGMFVCWLGLALASGVPLMWIVLPLYVQNMHRRVAIEEVHLRAHFGASWSEYAARVPRYLPLPGLR